MNSMYLMRPSSSSWISKSVKMALASFSSIFFSERAKDLLDLSAVDLAAAVFVEDLKAFNVVFFAAGVASDALRLLQDGVEVGELDPLGAQLGGSTKLDDRFVGQNASKSSQNIAQVKGVDIIAFISFVENNERVLCFTHDCEMRSTVKKELSVLKYPFKRGDKKSREFL